jgi:hypothetical protein
MARARKRSSSKPQSPFGSLLDEVMGSGVKYVVDTVRQAAPKCAFCGSPTILRCQACGQVVCNVHGYVNARSIQEVQTVCAACMSSAFDFVEMGPPPTHPEDGLEWHYDEPPWEILGVHAFSTVEEIEKAYKQAARKVHSDVGGSDEAMKRVNAARAYMKALRNRGQG